MPPMLSISPIVQAERIVEATQRTQRRADRLRLWRQGCRDMSENVLNQKYAEAVEVEDQIAMTALTVEMTARRVAELMKEND